MNMHLALMFAVTRIGVLFPHDFRAAGNPHVDKSGRARFVSEISE